MTITPGNYDITIYQGTTFSTILAWKDETNTLVDLTGYTARLQMRENYNSSTPFLNLTTENGGIVLGGVLGTITLLASAASTAALEALEGVYDLEMINGSTVIRLLQGSVSVSREVTR